MQATERVKEEVVLTVVAAAEMEKVVATRVKPR